MKYNTTLKFSVIKAFQSAAVIAAFKNIAPARQRPRILIMNAPIQQVDYDDVMARMRKLGLKLLHITTVSSGNGEVDRTKCRLTFFPNSAWSSPPRTAPYYN